MRIILFKWEFICGIVRTNCRALPLIFSIHLILFQKERTMAVVGLFYGSDTGNTENIAKMIQKQLGNELVDIRDIAKSTKEDIESYDFYFLVFRLGITVKHKLTGMIFFLP